MEWTAPPPARRHKTAIRGREIDEYVEQLKSRPGQWALVSTGKTSDGGKVAYKRRGCEVTVRGASGGPYDIYARWPAE